MKLIDAERTARGFENTAEQLEKQAAALTKSLNPEEAIKGMLADSNAATIRAAAKTLREDVPEATAFLTWRTPETDPPKVETKVLVLYLNEIGGYGITAAHYENGNVFAEDSEWNWEYIPNWGTYDEERDAYIIPEGWWERRHFNPDDVYNNRIDCPVVGWTPLPPKEVAR